MHPAVSCCGTLTPAIYHRAYLQVHDMKRLWEVRHWCQFVVPEVKIRQFREFLKGETANLSAAWGSKAIKIWKLSETFQHKRTSPQTYFKSSGFYATAFKFVEICVEQDQLGWQHGQFSQSVFFKDQLLKIVKTRKSADFDLGNEIPSQVDSSQCDWVLKREKSGGVQHTPGILHNWYHISTHVSKVFVPYFSDFIEACIQIASFLWK